MDGTWTLCTILCTFLHAVTILSANLCGKSESVEVRISQGTFRGVTMTSLFDRRFCAFKGVPYAQPPLGEFRFKAPRRPLPWTGILSATEDPPPCFQLLGTEPDPDGTEDCLLLNVFSPQLNTSDSCLLPVMVYIPGENWVSSAARNYGPEYLMDHDVVLVVMNYRLGPLGFLSTGDALSPGNYGLKDQVQALRWVKDNIKAFGGNPNSVTIFGHGAGAASVHYHLASPMSAGLFHRAIAQSGTSSSPEYKPYKSSVWARRLARLLGCPSANSEELVNCLRAADPETLVRMGSDYHTPVVETYSDEEIFLPDDPLNLIKNGNFNRVSLIMGTASSEGSPWAAMIMEDCDEIEHWNNHVDDFTNAPLSLRLFNEIYCGREMWEPLLNFYLGQQNHTLSAENSEALIKMFGDRNIYYPVHVATILLSAAGAGPLYMYNFDYKTQMHLYNFSAPFASYVGVTHGDELFFIFNLTDYPSIHKNSEEALTVSTLTRMWTDFAKYGNPTPQADVGEVVWEPVAQFRRNNFPIKFLHMTKAEPTSGKIVDLSLSDNLYKDRIKFWETLPLEDNKVLSEVTYLNDATSLKSAFYILFITSFSMFLHHT